MSGGEDAPAGEGGTGPAGGCAAGCSCETFAARCRDWMEHRLPAADRAGCDAHLAVCGCCRGMIERLSGVRCTDLVAFLREYVEGELPADRRAVFEAHLAECEECAAYLASYRRTCCACNDAAGAADGTGAAADDVPPRLVAAVLDAMRRRGAR